MANQTLYQRAFPLSCKICRDVPEEQPGISSDDQKRSDPLNPVIEHIDPIAEKTRLEGARMAWEYLFTQQFKDRNPPPSPWQFTNIADFEANAEKILPKSAWDYYNEKGGEGLSYQWNMDDFQKIKFSHRCLVDVSASKRNLKTTVLGHEIEFPIMISPAAYQALAHPRGEMANASAAAVMGTGFTLSTFSTFPLEDVARAQDAAVGYNPENPGNKKRPLRWYQLYHFTDELTIQLVKRAEKAGYSAIVVTADVAYYGNRKTFTGNWYSLPYPWDPANMREWAKTHGCGTLLDDPTWELMLDASLTWDTIKWLKKYTSLPIIVKGVQRSDDALKAKEAGAAAVWVSNHGARHLDTTPSTIASLPAIAKALKGSGIEIYLDGGVRMGTDVLKALALGARCVMIGRPAIWGLAAGGQAGVELVLKTLREELLLAMTLNGTPDVKKLPKDSVIVPHDLPVPPVGDFKKIVKQKKNQKKKKGITSDTH